MKTPFSPEEVIALLRAAGLADRLADRYPDAGVDRGTLKGAALKLQDLYLKGMCAHCKERRRTRRNGLCDRCEVYRKKYDRLPSYETLRATQLRRKVESK